MVLCTGQTCQSFFKKILKWKDVSALTTSLSLATSKNLGPGKNEHEHEPVWKTKPQGQGQGLAICLKSYERQCQSELRLYKK